MALVTQAPLLPPDVSPADSPRNVMDKLGSVMLKLMGKEQQWLWKDAIERRVAQQGGGQAPLWRDEWPLPKEEERDPMFVCRLLVALAAQHPADAAAPIPSQKQNVRGGVRAAMEPKHQIERLRTILFVLTGCRDFDCARFCGEEYAHLFVEGSGLHESHLTSNLCIVERAEQLQAQRRALYSRIAAEAAAKAQARLDAMLAEDATTSQATGEGGEGDMGGAEEGGGEQRPRSVGGSSKATVSELVSAHMLLGPPVLLALGVAYMMGPSACNGVLQC